MRYLGRTLLFLLLAVMPWMIGCGDSASSQSESIGDPSSETQSTAPKYDPNNP